MNFNIAIKLYVSNFSYLSNGRACEKNFIVRVVSVFIGFFSVTVNFENGLGGWVSLFVGIESCFVLEVWFCVHGNFIRVCCRGFQRNNSLRCGQSEGCFVIYKQSKIKVLFLNILIQESLTSFDWLGINLGVVFGSVLVQMNIKWVYWKTVLLKFCCWFKAKFWSKSNFSQIEAVFEIVGEFVGV